ncbi:hypothetical protein [Halobacillus sp. H74]|uniref:hypothetical protein n=1 Tax=Halobacillus sp. H74 TaxID=3457436 RepID=UPI003FCDC262
MNYNQNEKIAQITSQTLVRGVDIAKFKHVARAQRFKTANHQRLLSGLLSLFN